ncbi:MAG: class I SAM-dependent methyltransferase [bacterium]
MKNQKHITSKETLESYYFALQSSWGLTKHMGGLEATKELIELCRVDMNSYVLDVGCGVGITACYIAKEYGCKVIAIDISENMVKRAEERVKRKGMEEKIEFRIADAQSIPFEDDLFDAVISESVNAFIENKQKVINEYKRVVKPRGYVGFNEVTWIDTPPPELVEYLSRALGGAEFLTSEGWKNLLERAGFSDIKARTYKTTAWRQWASEVKEMDIRDFLNAWGKFLLLSFKSREVRRYIREISKPPKSVFRIFKYFGYGIYVGRK